MNHPIFDRFYKIGVIPVLEIDNGQGAKPLAESLLAGAFPVAEMTLRTDAALEAIRVIASQVQEMMIGAGSVVGGSWMAKRQVIADGKFDEITRMAQEASDVVKQVRRNRS